MPPQHQIIQSTPTYDPVGSMWRLSEQLWQNRRIADARKEREGRYELEDQRYRQREQRDYEWRQEDLATREARRAEDLDWRTEQSAESTRRWEAGQERLDNAEAYRRGSDIVDGMMDGFDRLAGEQREKQIRDALEQQAKLKEMRLRQSASSAIEAGANPHEVNAWLQLKLAGESATLPRAPEQVQGPSNSEMMRLMDKEAELVEQLGLYDEGTPEYEGIMQNLEWVQRQKSAGFGAAAGNGEVVAPPQGGGETVVDPEAEALRTLDPAFDRGRDEKSRARELEAGPPSTPWMGPPATALEPAPASSPAAPSAPSPYGPAVPPSPTSARTQYDPVPEPRVMQPGNYPNASRSDALRTAWDNPNFPHAPQPPQAPSISETDWVTLAKQAQQMRAMGESQVADHLAQRAAELYNRGMNDQQR